MTRSAPRPPDRGDAQGSGTWGTNFEGQPTQTGRQPRLPSGQALLNVADRIPYAEAGAATRDVLARARAAVPALSGSEWRALSIVLDRTVTWSKLEDRSYLGQLASDFYCVDRSTRAQRRKCAAAFRSIADRGLIDREPPKAGNPNDDRGPGYVLRVNAPGSGSIATHPDPGQLRGSTHPGSGVNAPGSGSPNAPRSGTPTEKGSREEAEEGAGPDLATRCLAVLDPAPKRIDETRVEILMLLTKLRRAHSDQVIGQALDDLVATGWTGEYCNRDLRKPLTARLARAHPAAPSDLEVELARARRYAATGLNPESARADLGQAEDPDHARQALELYELLIEGAAA